jgi:hypothetical protein
VGDVVLLIIVATHPAQIIAIVHIQSTMVAAANFSTGRFLKLKEDAAAPISNRFIVVLRVKPVLPKKDRYIIFYPSVKG